MAAFTEASIGGEYFTMDCSDDLEFVKDFFEFDFDTYLHELEELLPDLSENSFLTESPAVSTGLYIKQVGCQQTKDDHGGDEEANTIPNPQDLHLPPNAQQQFNQQDAMALYSREKRAAAEKPIADVRRTKMAKSEHKVTKEANHREDKELDKFKMLHRASQEDNISITAKSADMNAGDDGANVLSSSDNVSKDCHSTSSITTVTVSKRHSDEAIIDYANKVAAAFNFGDLNRLNSLMDDYMVENFILRSSFAPEPLVGIQHFKDVCAAVLTDRPDTVYKVGYSKLVRDKKSRERFLAVKFDFEQTRVSFLADDLDKMDENYVSMPELQPDDALELRQRQYVRTQTPYKAVGCKWLRYTLNENNQFTECMFATRLTSVQLFDLSAFDDDDEDD